MANDRPFTIRATNPDDDTKAAFVDEKMRSSMDALCDEMRVPRFGREPDYIHGRWCIRCHNSLPDGWGIKPCDVCGAETGVPFYAPDGLLQKDEERNNDRPPAVSRDPAVPQHREVGPRT